MIGARDIIIAAVALLLGTSAGTLLSASRAEEPLMKSAVFQWDDLSPTPTNVGAVRRVVRAPTATLDELESHITTLNANQSPHAPHQHPNEELLVLKEGTVDAYVNGEWVPVRTGGIMFFASNVPHTVRNVSDRPATYYVFNWSPAGILEKGTNTR